MRVVQITFKGSKVADVAVVLTDVLPEAVKTALPELTKKWVQKQLDAGSRRTFTYSDTDRTSQVFQSGKSHVVVRFRALNDNEILVAVSERPNLVFVVDQGFVHLARWNNNAEVIGDGEQSMCKAAMEAWGKTCDLSQPVPNGSPIFVLTHQELVDRAGGWL